VTEWLLGCGVVGAVLFVVTFIVDGATRPGYRASYLPVSALALGARGWVQTSNFEITGLLMVTAALGARDALQIVLGPALLGIFGVSLVASGLFPMDPMRGFPPGTSPGTPTITSRRHKLHDLFGFLVVSSLPAACIAFGFALPEGGWVIYSFATAAALIVLFVVFGAAWDRDSASTGFVQRLMIVTGWSWIALICLKLV
jgi:hypothetical protein